MAEKGKKGENEFPEIDSWELKGTKEAYLNEMLELKLLKTGIIVLHGDLNEEQSNKVCKKLLYLQTIKKKNVTILLNSLGGEVYNGLLIFDTMEDLKAKGMEITVEARGVCASMSVIILMGGSKKLASKYTRFLLHEVAAEAVGGSTSKVKEESEELAKVNKMLDEIISERSKISMKKLGKRTRRKDWWLSSEEALKLGLIDAIV